MKVSFQLGPANLNALVISGALVEKLQSFTGRSTALRWIERADSTRLDKAWSEA
jgi:hypothetical protein